MLEGVLVESTTRVQLESIATNPAHAVLLGGEAHIGKHLIARAIAAELLGVPTEFLDKTSNFREIQTVKGVLPIESIRNAVSFFSLVVPGRRVVKRVLLIPDAETMTLAAQNALLKVLEEPPVDSVILMTSSHVDRLLPTIRSRCQLCRIKKPSETEANRFLRRQYDETRLKNALVVSGGAVGAAKNVLDAGADDAKELTAAKAFLGQTLFEQLISIDAYAKNREDASRFVSLLLIIAEKGVLHSRSPQWQNIFEAALVADAALKKNANIKLVLMELALSLR